jgi:hypothetical protein
MNRLIIAISLIVSISSTAHASDDPDKLQKSVEYTMADILCTTHVIKDMEAAASTFFSSTEKVQSQAEKDRLKADFGDRLHAAWLNQKYDMKKHPDVVKFLNYALTLPMDAQADFAKQWSYVAHKRCPDVASDYRATYSAAMTLISTIPH